MADFISRISVVCFAASYGVALIFEASRLWFRSGVRGITMIGFVTAGLVAHSLYLIWRSTTILPYHYRVSLIGTFWLLGF